MISASACGTVCAMPSTAACFSRSAQICSNDAVSAQIPSHFGHSRRLLVPTATASSGTLHRGQSCFCAPSNSVRCAGAPQCEQNFAPRNMRPKQDGQAMVARRAPQCSQRVASLAAAAPHIGQLSVCAFTHRVSPRNAQSATPTARTRGRGRPVYAANDRMPSIARRSRLAILLRSFFSPSASIWRIRSRVRP